MALSTASTYPGVDRERLRDRGPARLRRRRGDGLDRPGEPGPRRAAAAVRPLRMPILAVHAPCLIVTQRVWGTDPWAKLRKAQVRRGAARCADRGGASALSVAARLRARVHQRRRRDGRRDRRAVRGGEHVSAASPGPQRHAVLSGLVTDRSGLPRTSRSICRTPASRSPTRWQMARRWATGSRTYTSPTAPAARRTNTSSLAAAPSRAASCSSGWPTVGTTGSSVVEVSTRKAESRADREADLAEALAFARLNLAAPADASLRARRPPAPNPYAV